MPLDKTIFRLEVSETGQNREYWASRQWVSGDVVDAIRSADILVVPWEDRGTKAPTFPQGTSTLFHKIDIELGDQKVTVAIDQDKYFELALHANEWRVPTFLVTAIAIPIFVSVISDRIEKLFPVGTTPTMVEMNVIVESEHGKCISVQYKGPPNELAATLIREIDKCLPGAIPAAQNSVKPKNG